MIRFHQTLLGAMVVILAACSQPPIAPKTSLSQESATTTRDWQAPARRIAAELLQRGMLLTPQPGVTPASPPWGPYFVHVTTPQSSFLRAVEDSLKAEIINAGGTVSRVPDGAVVINLKVDFVKHGEREQLPAGLGTAAGTLVGLTALAAGPGAWAANIGTWGASGIAAGAALASGIVADQVLATYPLLNAEAIWSATITGPRQLLLQVQDRFYIPASDVPLYHGDVRLAEMTTPGVAMTPTVQRMRYASAQSNVSGGAPQQPACPVACAPSAPTPR